MDNDDVLNDPDFPLRPQHQDFWRLSEIILQLDGKFSEGETDFEKFMSSEIDLDSITYMAVQRSLRLQGDSIGSRAAIYFEAFLMGKIYERRYGDK